MNIHKLLRRTRTHRHLVVVPAFLLVFAVSVGQGLHRGGTLVGTVKGNNEMQDLLVAGGMMGLPVDGGEAGIAGSSLELADGTLLVSAHGVGHVVAGPYELFGWHGSFQVTLEGESLSVAGLASPVLVRKGEHRAIVPANTQWRSPDVWGSLSDDPAAWFAARAVKPLPQHFLRDRLTLLQDLPDTQAAASAPKQRRNSILDALRLPGAERRHELEADSALLASILHDPSTAAAASTNPRFERALAEASLMTLGDLAATVPSGIGSDRILTAFMHSPEGAVLASFHDASRDRAWLLGEDAGEGDDLKILLLPQADYGQEAMLPIALERWQQSFAAFIGSKANAPEILQAWIPGALQRVSALAASGYPLRAKAYADAVRTLLAPYDGMIDASFLAQLQAAEAGMLGNQSRLEEAEELADEQAAELSEEVAHKLEAQAALWLRDAGTAMTKSSLVTAIDAQHVSIEHVVFPTAKGDKEASFCLNLETGEVSEIRNGAETLPFAMPSDGFLAWVKKGMEVAE